MKVKTLIICILAVLVVSNVSLAQVAEAPEQEPQEPAFQQSDSPTPAQPKPSLVVKTARTPTQQVQGSRRPNATSVARTPRVRSTPPSMSQKQLRIFELKHSNADELRVMISSVFRITAEVDYRLNRLIINATEEEIKNIENLIEAMDIEAPDESTSWNVQNLIYRVYMFELPSKDQNMKPFSMILRVSPAHSTDLLGAWDKDLLISEFIQSDKLGSKLELECLIKGRAASKDSLVRMVENMPKSWIKELRWDDYETFTKDIAAAHYTRLSDQMQKHIERFLGEGIHSIGYWFGSSSIPGRVEAPIGPWRLSLRLEAHPDRTSEICIEAKVCEFCEDIKALQRPEVDKSAFETRLGRKLGDEILSNIIKVEFGKPIIIGYNRQSYGTRKMGAMVILLEADTVLLETSGADAP